MTAAKTWVTKLFLVRWYRHQHVQTFWCKEHVLVPNRLPHIHNKKKASNPTLEEVVTKIPTIAGKALFFRQEYESLAYGHTNFVPPEKLPGEAPRTDLFVKIASSQDVHTPQRWNKNHDRSPYTWNQIERVLQSTHLPWLTFRSP